MTDLTKDKSRLLSKAAAFRSQIAKSKGPPEPAKVALSADEVNLLSQNVFLNSVLEALDHPFYVIDAHDYTVKLANAAANFAPLSEDSTCYALSHNRDAPCSGAGHICPLEQIKKIKKPITTEHVHYDKDGNRCYYEVHGYPLFDSQGNVTQVIEYSIDITDRKKAEAQNDQYQQQLKSLVLQLTHAEEQEQKRIADLLHDGLAQTMAFIKIKVDVLAQSDSSTVEAQALREISNSLKNLLEQTREMSFELRSPILQTLGLGAAIQEWLTEKVEKKHSLETRFEQDESLIPLPQKIQAMLFQMTRELLTNVVKHAGAHRVTVSLKHADQGVEVGVRDDGMGLDTEAMKESAGFGLFSIEERLASVGGHMAITSEPGQGTLVTLRAPLDPNQNATENKR